MRIKENWQLRAKFALIHAIDEPIYNLFMNFLRILV